MEKTALCHNTDGVESVERYCPLIDSINFQGYQLSYWTLQFLVTFGSHLGVGPYKLGYPHHLNTSKVSCRLETESLLVRERI